MSRQHQGLLNRYLCCVCVVFRLLLLPGPIMKIISEQAFKLVNRLIVRKNNNNSSQKSSRIPWVAMCPSQILTTLYYFYSKDSLAETYSYIILYAYYNVADQLALAFFVPIRPNAPQQLYKLTHTSLSHRAVRYFTHLIFKRSVSIEPMC